MSAPHDDFYCGEGDWCESCMPRLEVHVSVPTRSLDQDILDAADAEADILHTSRYGVPDDR